MKTIFAILVFLGAMSAAAQAAQDFPLLGTWNLDTVYREVAGTDERSFPYGDKPEGLLIVTEYRVLALVVPARAAGDTSIPPNFLSFSGPYRADGEGRFVYRLDVTLNPSPKGIDRPRAYKLDGDKLAITVLPGRKRPDGKEEHTVLTWTRGK
jgi:hypothetical protein